jgi:ABC-type uncharacterized transport system substrate-binding protein
MNTRIFDLFCLLITVFLITGFAEAQQPKNVPRIGYISAGTSSSQAPYREALRQGLRDLGYIDGQNIAIEYRYANEKLERQPALIAELVSLKVDVIVTAGAFATRSAKEATNMIPIVMAQAIGLWVRSLSLRFWPLVGCVVIGIRKLCPKSK